MARIKFPERLQELLDGSDLEAPIRGLADQVGRILSDNKLPFFPDYTDHGIDHINCVLKSEVELVPKDVWAGSTKSSDPRLLCDADAVVTIGATLLHDLGMHLRPPGFLELVKPGSRFQPLPWFNTIQEGRTVDRPWHELWDDYCQEARRFSDSALAAIIGGDSVKLGWKFEGLPGGTGSWDLNDCLVVGEFLRRHHARLAHEIAIYGFPGLPAGGGEGQFPAMGERGHPLKRLADLVGLTARSHGMSLRHCKAYLDHHYPRDPRPMGVSVLYPMALLRVADYLQIDQRRAPSVLLQLRDPQSPVSVREWAKHRMVENIGPDADPRAKRITVSGDVSLGIFLQLRELFAGLQHELDHSTAVLDEAYGTRGDLGLDRLGLAIRRVFSNLDDPGFQSRLPYVPERTGFSADPNLLALLVQPLYGSEPSVGVRELVQNGVDAVRELKVWCSNCGIPISSVDLPAEDWDVLVEFRRREDRTWFLRVQDKGIGMRSTTIQGFFLRAGASFRQSADWAKDFSGLNGRSKVVRAGRFGIGAFALFLLGPKFRLWTRHAGANAADGYFMECQAGDDCVELRRVQGLRVGTIVEVEVSADSVRRLRLDNANLNSHSLEALDWFCWDWPKVAVRVVGPGMLLPLQQAFRKSANGSANWSVIHPEGFEAVHWTFRRFPELVCNGIRIARPEDGHMFDAGFPWPAAEVQLASPCISITDGSANLPLTVDRYKLATPELPFIGELAIDVTLSFIGHALVCGPGSRGDAESAHLRAFRHPLSAEYACSIFGHELPEPLLASGSLVWCWSEGSFIPVDPWLYSLLNTKGCVMGGTISHNKPAVASFGTTRTTHAAVRWNVITEQRKSDPAAPRCALRIVEELVVDGFAALGFRVSDCRAIFSVPRVSDFMALRKYSTRRHYVELKHVEWRRMRGGDSGRGRLYVQTGGISPSAEMVGIIAALENATASNYGTDDSYYFVAEFETQPNACNPESLIAKVWSECLGPIPIPFEPTARAALIEHGRKHEKLKPHIERWEQMRRSGSE